MDQWKNTLNIKFTHENEAQDIDFQIGKNKIRGKNEINCFYERKKIFNERKKGKYNFKGFESLGTENTFKLNSFDIKDFYFYGYDDILPILDTNYYVSQVGSKIVFNHIYTANDDTLPPLYKNVSFDFPMNNCHKLNTSTKFDDNFAYCEITQEDLDVLNYPAEINYRYLCGSFYTTEIILYKLDTKLYPVFKANKFFKPTDDIITQKTDLIIEANVTGSSQYFQNEEGYFYTFMEIENQNKNKSVIVYCSAQINSQSEKSNLTCHLDEANATYEYQNLYLLPYSYLKSNTPIFEVFISTTIKAEGGPEPEPTDQQILNQLIQNQQILNQLILNQLILNQLIQNPLIVILLVLNLLILILLAQNQLLLNHLI